MEIRATLAAVVLLVPTTPQPSGQQPGTQPRRPNVLLCIADDASFPHMGAYGCAWVETPGFDRVAREGLLFTRAFTPNAKCSPSRACLLTGRNSWQLGPAANHWAWFPPDVRTYVEALEASGYFVGHTAKGWAPGVARTAEGEPRELTGPTFDTRRIDPPTGGIGSIDYAANFVDFLDARPEGRPFCFWYGAYEPHRGYEYGSGVAKGGKSLEQIDAVPGCWPDDETVRNDLLDYAFEIEWFDRHLQQMLAALEERGELDDTLVIVTADNGLPFPRAKGQAYMASNHLPLAIRWPAGIAAPGRVIDDHVSFIDLAPTFLEVAGVEPAEGGMQPIQGRSLLELFRSTESGRVVDARDHVLIGKERHDVGRPGDGGYPIRGIVTEDWLYLRNFEPERWPGGNPETGYLNCDGGPTKTAVLRSRQGPATRRFWELSFGRRPAEELYDLADDPDCLRNLADDPAHRERKHQLSERLALELRAQQDPRILGQGEVFDAYPYADERHRGFYERYLAGEQLHAGWVRPSDFEDVPEDGSGD